MRGARPAQAATRRLWTPSSQAWKPGVRGRAQARALGQERLEAPEPRQRGRERARQSRVVRDGQPPETREPAQLRGQRPLKLVAVEDEPLEVRQLAQLGRKGARQAVARELEAREPGEATELGRERARQVVAGQEQLLDPAQAVGPDTVPDPERPLAQPVVGLLPVRPVRRPVERRQRPALGVGDRDERRTLYAVHARDDRGRPLGHRRDQPGGVDHGHRRVRAAPGHAHPAHHPRALVPDPRPQLHGLAHPRELGLGRDHVDRGRSRHQDRGALARQSERHGRPCRPREDRGPDRAGRPPPAAVCVSCGIRQMSSVTRGRPRAPGGQ